MTDCVISGKPSSGTLRPSGLTVGGFVTEVTVTSGAWTALPPTALTGRNAIRIQNNSGVECKTNFDSFAALPAGYTGVYLFHGTESHYDITDQIKIYAKSTSGSVTLIVEEIA